MRNVKAFTMVYDILRKLYLFVLAFYLLYLQVLFILFLEL